MSKRIEAIGPKDANIFILGESPGRKEAREGIPFIGPAGKELDKLLYSASIEREECYITNLIKTLPPRDKKDFFFKNGNPTEAMMEGILEVIGEIKTVKPNVVVAVGSEAFWAMTQKQGILSQRGSILESTIIEGQKVIPVIHPAWFLRTYEWHKLPLTSWDWIRIKEQSKFPGVAPIPHNFIINPTPLDLGIARENLLSGDHITIDSEWYSPEVLAYIQFTNAKEWAIAVPAQNEEAFQFYNDILGSNLPKWGQNLMFDIPALYRLGIETKNVVHDTMIAWNATFGDLRSKSLATISSVLTPWPYYKDEGEFVGKDEDKGQRYGCIDAVTTDESMEKMFHEFNIHGTKKAYDISASAMPTFLRAAQRGTLADITLLKKKREEVIEKIDKIQGELEENIGRPINVRSYKQVCKLVYDELRVKSAKRSSEQKYLMDIAASTHDEQIKEVLTKIVRLRQAKKRISNYLNENIIDKDSRIKTNWNIAGTRNGRFSTTKPWWNGTPQQTFPWEDRDIFIADPGHVFIGWDLEQAEARVVAVLTGDYNLLDDLKAGIDIHTKLASELPLNLTYEELLEKIEEVGKDACHERYLAKQCRHAMNYWLSWIGLKNRINKEYLDTGVGVDAATAKRLRNSYLELSPELEAWWQEVYFELRDKGYLINAFGRRRQFLGKFSKGDHLHRDAIAFYPQSTIADNTTLAIVEMDNRMPYAQPMAHMHDGGYVIVPEEMKDDAIEIIKETTNKEMIIKGSLITVPSEVKVGLNWKEMEKVV